MAWACSGRAMRCTGSARPVRDSSSLAVAQRGEGPKVFRWRGAWWMIEDLWHGLGVFRSGDALHWQRQAGTRLEQPGRGPAWRRPEGVPLAWRVVDDRGSLAWPGRVQVGRCAALAAPGRYATRAAWPWPSVAKARRCSAGVARGG